MHLLRQILVLSRIALLSLPARIRPSLVVVLSMACVVGVLLSMLSETAGLMRAYRNGADSGRAVVMSSEYMNDYSGSISPSEAATIADAPGVARSPDGKPLADPELLIWVPPDRGYLVDSPFLRGISTAGLALHPGFRIVSGHLFRRGPRELVVGLQAARAFGLKVGDTVTLPDGKWPIVGTFEARGSILEGELVGDSETIMMAGHFPGFSSILVALEKPTAFAPFRRWLLANPALGVSAERQTDYYLRTASRFTDFFTTIAYAIGVIMTFGALFGSVKIMYGTVSSRAREIATLRAIGYEPLPLAISVVAETLLLALAGAGLGEWFACLLFNGRMIANWQNAFQASVSPALLVIGLAWAATLAIFAGLFPAIRAARLAVTDALRAV